MLYNYGYFTIWGRLNSTSRITYKVFEKSKINAFILKLVLVALYYCLGWL